MVTNPDRPAGRGMDLRPSPVKARAQEAGLEVLQPDRARDESFHQSVAALSPDVAVVVAYGKILPASLLGIPPLGFVNVHFSLLPLYRGAAPVQRAVMDGRPATGVSIMVLTEGMDEGPVLARLSTRIEASDTAGAVGDRLAVAGAELLVEALHGYGSGSLSPEPQDDDLATYAPKITTEEARIDWTLQPRPVADHVRGLNPVPGAWTALEGKRLKVWWAEPLDRSDLEPGRVDVSSGFVVGAGDGAVQLADVQLEGKKRMSGEDLARGLRLPEGTRLA